jgi:hypothetical protein
MASKSDFVDPLAASSYFHPSGSAEYAPLRTAVVEEATSMGYEVLTMTEHGVAWSDDQDPFGHVSGATYMHLIIQANFRVLESFAKPLKTKYDEFIRARGVGILNKAYNTNIKRQVVYPDCVRLLYPSTLVPNLA